MSTRATDYLELLTSLWRSQQKPPPGAPRPARPASGPVAATGAGRGDAAQADDVFGAKLEAFAARFQISDCLVAGRVTLFNTAAIKKRVGDRWDRLSDRIHNIIEAELRSRLTENDFFTRFDDENYLIVFGECTAAEARLKTLVLSEVILDRIFGESDAKDLEGLTVRAFVAKADGTVAIEELGSAEALMGLLDDAAAAEGKTAVEASLKLDDISQLLGDIDDQLAVVEEARRSGQAGAARADQVQDLIRQLEALEKALAAIESQPLQNGGAAAAGGLDRALETINRLRLRLELEMAGAPRGGSAPIGLRTREEPQIDLSYLPVWHAPTQRIGIYHCNAAIQGVDQAAPRRSGSRAARHEALFAAADRLALRKAWKDLERAQTSGSSSVVVVPVHFSTLQQIVTQDRLVDLCRHIRPSLRTHLIWEIVGADVGSWSLQLSELAQVIMPFGKAVFLRLENSQANLSRIAQEMRWIASAGIRSVGVDAAELSGSETEKLHLLDSLIDLADRYGLKCYGLGLDSVSLTMCAVCMGYQHVSGSAVGGPVSEPGGIRPTAMDSIYGRILSGQRETQEPPPPPRLAGTAS